MYCFQQENYKCEHTFSLWSQDGDHYLVLVWKKQYCFSKDYSEVSNALNDLYTRISHSSKQCNKMFILAVKLLHIEFFFIIQ